MLYLDQQNHLDKMLKRLNKTTILYTKLCPTNKIEIKEMENVPYAQAVGSLMYTLISTRPDISHAVGVVNRYQSNPRKVYWQAVQIIMRFCKWYRW